MKSNGITITLIKDDPEEHWTDVRPKVGLFGKTNEEKKDAWDYAVEKDQFEIMNMRNFFYG